MRIMKQEQRRVKEITLEYLENAVKFEEFDNILVLGQHLLDDNSDLWDILNAYDVCTFDNVSVAGVYEALGMLGRDFELFKLAYKNTALTGDALYNYAREMQRNILVKLLNV